MKDDTTARSDGELGVGDEPARAVASGGRRTVADRIERRSSCSGTRLEQIGRAVPMMAAALSTYLAGIQQIVIVEAAHEGISDTSVEREGFSRASDLLRTVVLEYLPSRSRCALRPTVNARWRRVCRSRGDAASERRQRAVRLPSFHVPQPVTTADALREELKAAS